VWGANCLNLDCISFEGTLLRKGLFWFRGQIVWNWTVYICGANCVELECICLGGKLFGTEMYRFERQNLCNWTL
jgi:hypothetical protein